TGAAPRSAHSADDRRPRSFATARADSDSGRCDGAAAARHASVNPAGLRRILSSNGKSVILVARLEETGMYHSRLLPLFSTLAFLAACEQPSQTASAQEEEAVVLP